MTEKNRTPASNIAAHLWLARVALLWEALWPALWPALGFVGIFFVLVFFDVLPLLPGWLHGIVLAGLAVGFVWSLYRALPALLLPGTERARRRLEQKGGLSHRPLTAIEDSLATGHGDEASEALWFAHRQRMRSRVGDLRFEAPRPELARRDPWALRGALLLLLVVGATIAWNDSINRLERALSPRLVALGARAPASLEVWITPPDYTGLAPRFLRFGAPAVATGAVAAEKPDGAIDVPIGSVIMAQLYGGRGTPQLRGGGIDAEFQPISVENEKKTYQVEVRAEKAGRMSVSQGGAEVGAWTLAVTKDTPPSVAFASPPASTQRASLRLEYQALDDYGVAEVTAIIRRKTESTSNAEEEPIVLKLPLPGTSPKKARSNSYHDLTAHIWAGLPVRIQLSAQDAIEQIGRSEIVDAILPEREFQNRLAKLLVEARKQLVLDPGKRREVARLAARRATRPEDYRHDIVVFMALKSVHDRLLRDDRPEAVAEVQQLLWDTALRIEDGGTAFAERALKDAEQALRDALERDADDAELQELVDQLQQALEEYFQALAEDMQRNPGKYQSALPPDPDMEMLEPDDLKRLLDQIRQMAESGAKESAKQMLSQLRDMLENLRMGSAGPPQPGQDAANKLMKSMEDLMRRQQELLDKTFRDAQQHQDSRDQKGPPNAAERAAEQEALRRDLGNMMRQLDELTGQIPGALGRAERAMQEARRALEKEQPGQALGPQGRALEELRAGMGESLRQLARQFGPQMGLSPNGRGRRSTRRDPMGRPYGNDGNAWSNEIMVPDETDAQQARRIRDELQRRAGERQREQLELDYIERLLRRF